MTEKQSVIKRWLEKARRDLRGAKILMGAEDAPTDIICFHCQQCAEKSLKAFLVAANHDFPKTHDLLKLLKWCRQYEDGFTALRDRMQALTGYAVEIRYVDEAWFDVSSEDAEDAIVYAEDALALVTAVLGKP